MHVQTSKPVQEAVANGQAVVALESTVYSNLGLPTPHNQEAVERSIVAIEQAGAVPAITAVIDGVPRAGLSDGEIERVLSGTQKTAERDIPVAIGQKWSCGVTTVSASLAIAAAAGIAVFATGGIGGVHRGSEHTGDVSADLGAIARHPVATVSAGAKSFLDLPRTIQLLETLGVPVLGWQTDHFPAFTARTSGIELRIRVDDVAELAAIVEAQRDLVRGTLIVNPVPEADALDQELHDQALMSALQAVEKDGISGPAVTPFVLDRIAQATGGDSIPANLSLVENNATLAAQLALAIQAG